MQKYIQAALKWLQAVGAGGLTVLLVYLVDAFQAIPVDFSKIDGLILAAIVTGATKLLGYLIAKLNPVPPEIPPA